MAERLHEAQDIRTASGRPIGTLATSTLRRFTCGLCDQRLDRLRRSADACGSLFDRGDCHWHRTLNEAAALSGSGEP